MCLFYHIYSTDSTLSGYLMLFFAVESLIFSIFNEEMNKSHSKADMVSAAE